MTDMVMVSVARVPTFSVTTILEIAVQVGWTLTGPNLQSSLAGGIPLFSPDGTLYARRGPQTWPGIYISTGGNVYAISQNERLGFRDDCPAALALFDPQANDPAYPGSLGIAPSRTTNELFYLTDGFNGRLRRLYKNAGQWWVDTVAGAGYNTGTSMSLGTEYDAPTVKLSSANMTISALCVDFASPENVWIPRTTGLVKITPSTGKAKLVSTNSAFSSTAGICADQNGLLWFFNRGTSKLYTYDTSDGTVTQRNGGAYTAGVWDGPIADGRNFHPSMMVIAPDASVIYGFAGDELTIRRITTPLSSGRYQTLNSSGGWDELTDKQDGWQIGVPMALDGSGNLYVGQRQNTALHPIRRFVLP